MNKAGQGSAMTEKDNQENQEVELQGMLAKRLVVAGVLVGVLLAVLAFFDYLATQEETPDPPVFTEPVPVPPKKALSQPVTPVIDDVPVLPAEPVDPALIPPEPAPAEPLPPPPPEVAAKPETTVPAPVPATVAAPAGKPGPASRADVPVAAKPPAQPPSPVSEGTSAPVSSLPTALAPVAKPTANVIAPPEAPVRPALQPVPARPLASGYVVQAGVFSSTKAAEELHAKLTLNGIPSTLETRVQIGPFKNRAEAEAARQKLKALGIEGMMIPPAGRR